jgi:hypothetical protein
MKSSKLIQILSTLSEKEYREFEKMANQVHYKNEKIIAMLSFLSFHFPAFEPEEIQKEIAFRFIFKDALTFEDIKIREILSALLKTAKDFLIFNAAKENTFRYEIDLLKQYQKRKLDNLYLLQLKTVNTIIEADEFENKEFYRRKFLLASIENEHFTGKQVRELDQNIQIKLDNLDYYYFSLKLQESCEMLNRQRLLNQSYQFHLFDDIEKIIEKYSGSYLNHPTIICYYEIYKLLLTNDDKTQFDACVNMLKNHIHHFSNEELKIMFDFPQNYCIAHTNKGNETYLEPLFDLQNYLISKAFYQTGGFISSASYVNIVSIALKLKKYEWSDTFIENYKEKISPLQRDNAYNMCKANLYYTTSDFDNTLALLHQIEFTDVYYAYFAKVIQLKTYYALKEYETLSYFVNSFKLYLKRNQQLPSNFKKGADVLLVFFKRILALAEKEGNISKKVLNEKLELIYQDIILEKNIHNRAWLLELIAQLRQ